MNISVVQVRIYHISPLFYEQQKHMYRRFFFSLTAEIHKFIGTVNAACFPYNCHPYASQHLYRASLNANRTEWINRDGWCVHYFPAQNSFVWTKRRHTFVHTDTMCNERWMCVRTRQAYVTRVQFERFFRCVWYINSRQNNNAFVILVLNVKQITVDSVFASILSHFNRIKRWFNFPFFLFW